MSAGRRLAIHTPEGIPLHVQVASRGSRALAFLIDAGVLLAVFVVVRSVLLDAWMESKDLSFALALVFWFLFRTFYFTAFETRWQGRTPGKRMTGIRVMDAAGGPLRTDAVIVRNLMREVELFQPGLVFIYQEYYWPDAPTWARFGFLLWWLAFALMPLFNRDSLRAGDMVAGTLVVEAPQAGLRADLGARGKKAPSAEEFRFSRRTSSTCTASTSCRRSRTSCAAPNPTAARRSRRSGRQIRKKIRWKGPAPRAEEHFLREFYKRLRARLEHKMLLGRRKEDKHSKD